MAITGYKVFNPDWTCRGFQYEVGKTYTHEGDPKLCGVGFHFCRKVADCFRYYQFDPQNKVAEISATGRVQSDGDKSVTDEITIIREVAWAEMLELANAGSGNSGIRNSGDYNSGNHNSGWLNTVTPPLLLFNKPTTFTREDILSLTGIRIINRKHVNNWWIYSQDMTDEEKQQHPEHETTGGYLKSVSPQEAYAIMWESLDEKEKDAIRSIPNFDPDIFFEITGIRA